MSVGEHYIRIHWKTAMSGHVVHAGHRFKQQADGGALIFEAFEATMKEAMQQLARYYLLNLKDTSAATALSIEFEKTKAAIRVIHATHEKGQQS